MTVPSAQSGAAFPFPEQLLLGWMSEFSESITSFGARWSPVPGARLWGGAAGASAADGSHSMPHLTLATPDWPRPRNGRLFWPAGPAGGAAAGSFHGLPKQRLFGADQASPAFTSRPAPSSSEAADRLAC